MPEFVCSRCQAKFSVPEAALKKYPGWNPHICRPCKLASSTQSAPEQSHAATSPRATTTRSFASATREEDLPVAEVLRRYTDGPKTGVFTDGAANPNPGPGGWGAVYVVDDVIRAERFGSETQTTNNRMELAALMAGIELVPKGTQVTLYTDSQLCVNTFTQWAQGWERRGWKKKQGEIKNLELVKSVYYRLLERPEIELRWIAAHNGFRWNEYADALATAYRRSHK